MLRRLRQLETHYDGPPPAEALATAWAGGTAARRRQRAQAQEKLFARLAGRTLMALAQRRLTLRHLAMDDARLAGLGRALADSRDQALRWRGDGRLP